MEVYYIGIPDNKAKMYNAINKDSDECGSVMGVARGFIQADGSDYIIIEYEFKAPCIVGVIE